MKNKKPITGIILAGGKSSRMNDDKGLIFYKQKPFIQYVIDAVQPLVGEIIIVSSSSEYDIFKQKRVADLIKNVGPLAGIYTGLFYSKTKDNLILSCDIPLIKTAILSQLIDQTEEFVQVVQIESQNKTMPLIAFYKKESMRTCLNLIESGERRVRFFVDQLKSKTVKIDDITAKYVTNINTPEELKKIKG